MIVPAYNEEQAIAAVLAEWLEAVRRLGLPFRLLAINDGSRDGTLAVLEEAAARNAEVIVVDQANRGHGQSCMAGYRRAVAEGAEWVLQIDSDGQCDPSFFPSFWAAREGRPAILGRRTRRDDGWMRRGVSLAVRFVVWLAAGTWVLDANVPYRLVRGDALASVIDDVPADFHLANILVAVLLERRFGIHWIPIRFRDRRGGSPSVRTATFLTRGAVLYRQLARERRRGLTA